LGDIDGATLGPQGAIEDKKAGLNLLVNAADVIDLPLAGIGATKKRIVENSDQIRRLLRASLKGIQYIRENRTGTVDIIKTWFKLEPGVAAQTYDLAFKAFSRDGEVNEKGIRLSMDLARLSGKFDKDISLAELVDFTCYGEPDQNWVGNSAKRASDNTKGANSQQFRSSFGLWRNS
jgi:ABC-type nitrate/sulfonate/bicarbonate transport system substrate-binding protein